MFASRRSRLIFGRSLQLIPILLLVTFIVFLMIRLAPGDPAIMLAGDNPTDAQIDEIRRIYGLDQPIFIQYGSWLLNILQGNFSQSMMSREPVINIILNTFPNTLLIVVYAMIISLVVGIPLGIAAAARPDGWLSSTVASFSSVCAAVPSFWVGMILVTVFALGFRLFPATGLASVWDNPLGAIYTATLPAIAVAINGIAEITRQLHAALTDFLASPHARTLNAKGLRPSAILWRHGLRNVGITLITVSAIIFANLLGGTTVIEMVFAIPGSSRTAVIAAINKDYVVVQGIVLCIATAIVLVNLLTDILYVLFDPRID
jgi:peptide/nickel transport system permease protein